MWAIRNKREAPLAADARRGPAYPRPQTWGCGGSHARAPPAHPVQEGTQASGPGRAAERRRPIGDRWAAAFTVRLSDVELFGLGLARAVHDEPEAGADILAHQIVDDPIG